jgi:hypothetical protein
MHARTWLIGGLVTLNVVLVGALVSRTVFGSRTGLESVAYGQAHGRLEIVSVTGDQNGQQIQFVMDANTGRMIALRVDVQKKEVVPIATTDFEADSKRAFR